MSDQLERRYRLLLRLYPAEYRRTRGNELLGTLLDAAEDGRRRQMAALVLGALRAHAGRDERQDVKHSWLAAIHAAAVMLLVHGTASDAARVVYGRVYGLTNTADALMSLVAPALGLCALIAAVTRRYLLAAGAAALTFVVALVLGGPDHLTSFSDFWAFPLAIGLLVTLTSRRPGPVSGLLRYAFVAPLLLVAADFWFPEAFPDVTGILQRAAPLALCAGALLWIVVDERVAMALGLMLISDAVIQLVIAGTFFAVGSIAESPTAAALAVAVPAVGPAVLLSVSAVTARRQARL